jgi:ABC-type branched-subunit amino acid transport system ATPase component
MTTPLCQVEHLSKSFAGLRAVADVDLTLNRGILYGLIGPNGAGKTTLVSLLSGGILADEGVIRFDGQDITTTAPHTRAMLGVGRTFQRTRLPESMTVREAILVGCLTAGRAGTLGYLVRLPAARRRYAAARASADRLIDMLDLSQWAGRLVRDTPFVARRRAEIARALSLNPRLLLLDEPTAGMSRDSLPAISSMLKTLTHNGLTVLIVEHNVPFIRDTVDQLFAMDASRKIAEGDPTEVLSQPSVVESYVGQDAKRSTLL